MLKILVALCAVCILAGCAATPMQGEARPARGGAFALATIAPWGSFEFEAAPAYTRLAVARRLAANRLDAGIIDLGRAQRVQLAADAARAALDAARARADRGDRDGARNDLVGAVGLVLVVEQILESER